MVNDKEWYVKQSAHNPRRCLAYLEDLAKRLGGLTVDCTVKRYGHCQYSGSLELKTPESWPNSVTQRMRFHAKHRARSQQTLKRNLVLALLAAYPRSFPFLAPSRTVPALLARPAKRWNLGSGLMHLMTALRSSYTGLETPPKPHPEPDRNLDPNPDPELDPKPDPKCDVCPALVRSALVGPCPTLESGSELETAGPGPGPASKPGSGSGSGSGPDPGLGPGGLANVNCIFDARVIAECLNCAYRNLASERSSCPSANGFLYSLLQRLWFSDVWPRNATRHINERTITRSKMLVETAYPLSSLPKGNAGAEPPSAAGGEGKKDLSEKDTRAAKLRRLLSLTKQSGDKGEADFGQGWKCSLTLCVPSFAPLSTGQDGKPTAENKTQDEGARTNLPDVPSQLEFDVATILRDRAEEQGQSSSPRPSSPSPYPSSSSSSSSNQGTEISRDGRIRLSCLRLSQFTPVVARNSVSRHRSPSDPSEGGNAGDGPSHPSASATEESAKKERWPSAASSASSLFPRVYNVSSGEFCDPRTDELLEDEEGAICAEGESGQRECSAYEFRLEGEFCSLKRSAALAVLNEIGCLLLLTLLFSKKSLTNSVFGQLDFDFDPWMRHFLQTTRKELTAGKEVLKIPVIPLTEAERVVTLGRDHLSRFSRTPSSPNLLTVTPRFHDETVTLPVPCAPFSQLFTPAPPTALTPFLPPAPAPSAAAYAASAYAPAYAPSKPWLATEPRPVCPAANKVRLIDIRGDSPVRNDEGPIRRAFLDRTSRSDADMSQPFFLPRPGGFTRSGRSIDGQRRRLNGQRHFNENVSGGGEGTGGLNGGGKGGRFVYENVINGKRTFQWGRGGDSPRYGDKDRKRRREHISDDSDSDGCATIGIERGSKMSTSTSSNASTAPTTATLCTAADESPDLYNDCNVLSATTVACPTTEWLDGDG